MVALNSCVRDRNAIILSVKPRYVTEILEGKKKVEFRRVWTKEPIDTIYLYATSPIKRIVGIVSIGEIIKGDFSTLLELSKNFGGSVTSAELKKYLSGKDQAYGLMLRSVRPAHVQVDPKGINPNFVAPQSYRYLSHSEAVVIFSQLFNFPN